MSTDRWTNEMLDNLAETVATLAQTVSSHQKQNEERDRRMDDLAENMGTLLISMERLSQTAIDYSRWKVETDQRFNILLEEVRTSNLRIVSLEQRT